MIEPRSTNLLLVLWLFIGAASATSCAAPTPHDYLASGDRYLKAKQYPEAIIEYRNAVTRDPKSGNARLKLAGAYMQRSSLAAAAKEYKNAAELLPDDADAQLEWLGILQLGKNYEEVREGTEKLLLKNPQNAAAQVLHARANAGLKEFDLGLSELRQAIVDDPPNSDKYYVNLGAVQLLATPWAGCITRRTWRRSRFSRRRSASRRIPGIRSFDIISGSRMRSWGTRIGRGRR